MLPTGTITFLFTDIQGSTPLWELKPQAMKTSIARHHSLLRQAIESCGGIVFKIVGDAFQAAFRLTSQGLAAALEAQRLLQAEAWGETGSLRVRMGLHTGPAELDEHGDYAVSHTLNRAARVMSAAYGGQILLSQEAADLAARELPPGVTLKDLGDQRMKGMTRLEHIYQVVAADLVQNFPPLSTGIGHPNNLPAQLSSFVGREAEIAELNRLLNPSQPAPNRLVTLTGPGGTGKTRLSLQAGYDLLEAFSGGVWFIELAPLADPELVPQTAMTALGLQAEPNRPPLVVLSDFLCEKTALLILDNCEHLVEASARLSDDLLRACSRLRILANSREALGISGETTFRVAPLSVAKAERPTPAEVLQSDAGRLFVERAKSIQPGFAVTAENAPAIAKVCRRLDGIPLAIELAAARVKVLTAEQIAARLDDRFRLLTGGSRMALPRHQTLKALVDWSWELLSPAEQAMLRRLSVFAGGWTLEAAEKLIDDPVEALDLLSQLVNKSLILVESQTGPTNRYSMLETIRQYGRERLLEAGESQAMRNRHRDWFLELAEQAEPELKRQGQLGWINRLEIEHDNLRLALEWSLEQEEAGPALRLAAALYYFWWMRNYYEEGRRWLEAALTLAWKTPGLRSSLWRARALLGLSWILWFQGDFAKALSLAEDGLSIARELADRQTACFALYIKGGLTYPDNSQAARSYIDESLAMSKAIKDRWIIAGSLLILAWIVKSKNYREGRALIEESVALSREIGDKLGLIYPLAELSWMVLAQGDFAQARLLYEESLVISREYGSRGSTAKTLINLSVLARWQGDFASAYALNQESLAIFQELGNRIDLTWAECLLAELDLFQSHFELARLKYEENLKFYREIGDLWKAGWCLGKIGDACYRLGDYVRANAALEESLSLLKQDAESHSPLLLLGDVARSKGDYAHAASYYRQSLMKLRDAGILLFVPARLEAIAKLALAQSKPKRAARLLGAAQSAREQMGTPILPLEQADYERNLAALRSIISEESFATAWEAGQAMPLEQAMISALAEEDDD